jgi:C4-dicarboxylate-specific signal transduction histidine kinase
MSWKGDILGEAGLQFFGEMSASISHEIKNALAIINESAGLLEDLSLRAEKGVPVEPERLKKQAGTILKQIQRADGIVQNMNKFAHSIDEPVKKIDLGQTVELVIALSSRLATMRGITLESRSPQTPLTINTRPFFLENLLWLCLDFAMGVAGAGKTVSLNMEKTEAGVKIKFTCLEGLAAVTEGRFPGGQVMALLSASEAELHMDQEKGEISLALSEKLPSE